MDFKIPESFNDFEELKLRAETLRGIYGYGWEKPSEIQKQALVPFLNNNDMIIQACAGSGKTGVFGIGSIEKVKSNIKNMQVLIISPTRELSVQTYNIICTIAQYSPISVALHRGCSTKLRTGEKLSGTERASGYMSYGESQRYCEQIVVATPGRILDLFRRKQISCNTLSLLILDEADELLTLSNEFQTTLKDILSFLPVERQTIVVSATIPSDVLSFVQNITNSPKRLLMKNEELPLAGIKQYYVVLEKEQDKILCLIDIYSNISIQQSIIFVNRKEKVDYICEQMRENGFTVSCIYGTMSQVERDSIMADFRKGVTRVLIATDLLARGIDVQSVSMVFNYDLPNNKENYIHRIGRSGRYGRKGVAVNFVLEPSGNKPKSVIELENFYGCQISPLPQLDLL
uniref:RNA helicase n=1 Tax=viral metagenome TaxID=1070528 RepID=A0A6C0LYU4_9ZZZZ